MTNIKELASQLKEINRNKTASPKLSNEALPFAEPKPTDELPKVPTYKKPKKRPQAINVLTPVEPKQTPSKTNKRDAFAEILNQASQQDQFNLKSQINIDSDLQEIFKMIKKAHKVSIGQFCSYLLMQFVTEHKASIEEIIRSQSTNKFIDV